MFEIESGEEREERVHLCLCAGDSGIRESMEGRFGAQE